MNSDLSRVAPATDFKALVNRTQGLQPWRRVFHAAVGVVLAALLQTLGPKSLASTGLLGFAVAFGIVMDVVRLNSGAANRWFFSWFSALASPREAAGVASSTWYVVGIFAVHLVFPASVLVPSILVLALADPAASWVGRLWGRRKLGTGSLEGTLVFWAVAAATLTPFLGVPKALWVAALVATAEALPTKLDDNLVIPAVTALTLWLTG